MSGNLIIDSATNIIIDTNLTQAPKYIQGSFKIPLSIGSKFQAIIRSKDLNRPEKNINIIELNKTDSANIQFYHLHGSKHIFSNFTNDSLLSISSHLNEKKRYVRYYNVDFPVARPPFANATKTPFNTKANKELVFNETEMKITMPDTGFVFISKQESGFKNGFAIFKSSKDFPKITSGFGLVAPLRFICSNDEYSELATSENPRKSVESFWIKKCGSKERARELIKQYYSRVNNSNLYFTSYIEGWKTDRGMVSIIYGRPTTIIKRKNVETWHYGSQNSSSSLSFTFEKVENPLSSNDFRLMRNINFKPSWYRALEFWRAGRVYTAG